MEDRIVVDFNALDRIAKKLNTAGKELDAAMSVLSSCRMTNDGGANLRVNTSCRVTTTGVSAGGTIVSQAISSYRSALGGLGAYTRSLSNAVAATSASFSATESGLGRGLQVGNTGASDQTGSAEEYSFWKSFIDRFGPIDIIKSFGNAGKLIGLSYSATKAASWSDWTGIVLKAGTTVSNVVNDYKNYKKIGRAIGTKNAVSYFLRKQVGLRKVGRASTASSPISRFRNNLHNKTSPYNIRDAFSSLTGKKGARAATAAWAGVALSGITNAFSNIKEQKESGGTMSTGRVIAETVTETAIDTVVTYGASAVVGAAITAVTGVVAAPVVVAVATGIALAGINAGVEALTGKSATEFVSDLALDTVVNVGKGIKNCAKAVGSWFSKLSFA